VGVVAVFSWCEMGSDVDTHAQDWVRRAVRMLRDVGGTAARLQGLATSA
jgi:hypothetical protein